MPETVGKFSAALTSAPTTMPQEDSANIELFFGRTFSADSLFCALPRRSARNLNKIKKKIFLPGRTTIFPLGAAPPGIYILVSGEAGFFYADEAGKNVFRSIEPGAIIGLTETLAESCCKTTVQTISPCDLEFIERDAWFDFLLNEPSVCFRLARTLADDLQKNFQIIAGL